VVRAERELVELRPLAARGLSRVVGAPAFAQALERVALAGGVDEGGMAGLDLGVAPVELAAGHFPMVTHPRELAEALERLA